MGTSQETFPGVARHLGQTVFVWCPGEDEKGWDCFSLSTRAGLGFVSSHFRWKHLWGHFQ